MIIKRTRKPRAEALLQIILLIIGIVAISYAIGSSVEVVSGAGEDVVSASDECTQGQTQCDSSGYWKARCDSGKWVNYYDCRNKGATWSCSGQLCVDYGTSGDSGSGGNKLINFGRSVLPYLPYLEKLNTKKSSTNDPVNNEPGIVGSEGLDQWMKESEEELYAQMMADSEYIDQELAKVEPINQSAWEKFLGGEFVKLAKKLGETFIVKTALSAALIYGSLKAVGWLVGDVFGAEDWGKAISSAAPSAALAYTAGALIVKLGAEGGLLHSVGAMAGLATIPGLGWILAGVTVALKLIFWRTEAVQVVTYECGVWQPEIGGAYCDECNKDIFPCTEYRCKSLGAACEIINQGEVDQMCISSKDDGKYPIITAWDGALLSSNYGYAPAGVVAPPDKGVYVQYTQSDDKCVPAFTKLSFGVTLNEAAYCRASVERKDNFSEMTLDLSGGLGHYNHSIEFSLPGVSALEANNITLENGGNFDLYVRCEDYHGHSNPANFVFKFCVDEGPDYTSPNIETASPLNGAPIANDQELVEAIFYINEPAECRWSHLNQDYENMENTMTCATRVTEMNAYMLYPCTTTLAGLQNNIENKFYVRCKDQPSSTELRNTNTESYEYTLIGTEPLILNWVTPNNTLVEGPTTSVKVEIEAETSAGYDDGISTCYYSETGDDGSYVQFYDTNSFKHSQDLWVSKGSYDFYIRCVDLGGNTDNSTITFDVETDTSTPEIVRVYREGEYLKLITDEEAECRYGTSSNVGCNYNFEEGTLMTSTNDLKHYVDWNSNVNFYIKCGETREGGLYPPQNECSLIVRPFDIYS